MTTPSGTISLNDVNVELGFAGTTLISMNQANVRTLAGVGGSGTTISMNNLRGKSNRVTASATISSNTSNYVLNTAKAPGYSAGKTDMTLTINSGVYVSSGSTGSYALTVDTSWTTGDTVTIINSGVIVGKGGEGGGGGGPYQNPGTPGSSAGPALLVQRATSINNANRIAGGGGGGGGGGSYGYPPSKGPGWESTGGGGGGGIGGGSGSPAGSLFPYSGGIQFSGGAGTPGTPAALGPGGGPAYNTGGGGGPGGTYGSGGSAGQKLAGAPGGSGGGAGAAIGGYPNISWIATGTINGSTS